MKILVFGRLGQVGKEVGICSSEYEDTEIIYVDRKVANLENPKQCAEAIYLNIPDLIINAAAYTNVEKAEDEEELANTINGYSPTAMAEAAKSIKCPFIHISTDYVFDGLDRGPKSEGKTVNPLNAYGRSKLLGEVGIQKSNCVYLILRTSWVFSSHGNNFVKYILNASEKNKILEVVCDQFGGPTSAKELARAILNISYKLLHDSSLKGIYHFSGSPDVSWSSFADFILEDKDEIQVKKIKTRDHNSRVKRPLDSCLDCSKIEKNFGISRPFWKDNLKIVLKELRG
jgi:dTDP-4-dehydrorhamnose reductase